MSFRETFIQKAKLIYKEDVNENRSRENAENFILNYFKGLESALLDEIEVAGGELDVNYNYGENLIITLDQIDLKFVFESKDIKIYIKSIDFQEKEYEEQLIDSLELKGDQFISKSRNQFLDDDLLDTYLQIAFEKELDRLLEGPAY